ncbi:MAG: hypothetical protein JSR36_03855 [Proteobacteria bacterium]|nr:hypothetical protein [Pseudomonadota bacterium]
MPQFSRPVYEGLPWVYITCGLLMLGGSYLISGYGVASLLTGVLGLVALLGGVVVLLRRRDYRELRSQYPDELMPRKDEP